MRGESVHQNGGAIGEQEARADALNQPEDDHLQRARIALPGVRKSRMLPTVKMAKPRL